ncbi:hypothetical protein [Micromonospora psammae]
MLINTVLVNGLILATSPLVAVLMLGDPGSRLGRTLSPSARPAPAV